MGKKKKSVLDAEYVPFSEGMKAKGFNEASIAALWGVLVPFSDYAFNKAHTAAYGLVSYWTAYLKANYPAEYMAALLTSVGDDKDKSALYLGECRRMGIKVLPPDVNDSIGQFAAVGTDIRFGHAGDPQRRAQRRRGDHRGARGEGRASPPSATSCRRCRRSCATSAPSSRSSRAVPSTGSPRPGWACSGCTRSTSTRSSRSSARRPSARTACSGRSATTRPATPAAT